MVELCSKGNLEEFRVPSLFHAWLYASQLSSALEYLESKKLIHTSIVEPFVYISSLEKVSLVFALNLMVVNILFPFLISKGWFIIYGDDRVWEISNDFSILFLMPVSKSCHNFEGPSRFILNFSKPSQ